MQYVYVLGDLLVTTIDVRLHAVDQAHTGVDVTYTRTALRPEANEHAAALGKHDGNRERYGRRRSMRTCCGERVRDSRWPGIQGLTRATLRWARLLC
jgi:hypothetical protein